MNTNPRLAITDQASWHKTFEAFRPGERVSYIGTNTTQTLLVVSTDQTVATRYAQVLHIPHDGYRLVNLGEVDIRLATGDTLAPRTFVPLRPGTRVAIGNYQVTFQTGAGAPLPDKESPPPITVVGVSRSIELTLTLPGTEVVLGRPPLKGAVTLRNLGKRPSQFTLRVAGQVPPGWCRIGEAPVLSPGATQKVPFSLYRYTRALPSPGRYTFTVQASAEAYGGELASATQLLRILSDYAHAMRIIKVT